MKRKKNAKASLGTRRKKAKSSLWTRRKRKKKKKTVAELPLEVWEDILSRLPFKLVLLCRCICRAWNALLARIHHTPNPTTPAALLYYNSHNRWSRNTSQSPWGKAKNHLVLAELRDGASYASTVTNIEDRYTFLGGDDDNFLIPVASCHGLVCFIRNGDICELNYIFVGNPLLKEELLVVRPFKMRGKETIRMDLVGFGFSPAADRYKIVAFFCFYNKHYKYRLLICTVGGGCRSSSRVKRKVCFPSWRRLSFPSDRGSCPLGSHFNAGIHWLFCHNNVFISRLDLDTEQLGRVETPQSPDFNTVPFEDLSLGVSDGHLIICASLRSQNVLDIWVMNQFNSWTKKLVVRGAVPFFPESRVELLNYGKVEAAAREGAVAEVMLMHGSHDLLACTIPGGHVRHIDLPYSCHRAIVHTPNFLSIRDVSKL